MISRTFLFSKCIKTDEGRISFHETLFSYGNAVQTLRNTILVSIFVGGSAFQYGFLFLNTPTTSAREQARALILSTLLFSSFLCWAGTIRYANHLAFSIGALDFKIKEVELREKQEKERADNLRDGHLEAGQELEIPTSDVCCVDRSTDPFSLCHVPTNSKKRTVAEIMDGLNELSVSMSSSFSLGFRFLFVSIPFAFYAAGPVALIIASGVILIFLFDIDHVQKSTYSVMAGFVKLKKVP
jgi:Protein of unknown function, DUF599